MAQRIAENLVRKLEELRENYSALEQQLLDPDVLADHKRVHAVSARKKALEPVVSRYTSYLGLKSDIDELEQAVSSNDDAELVAMAHEELPRLRDEAESTLSAVQEQLVTADDDAITSIIVEVRAGVGGDEAGIWAGDLVEMYQRYAASRHWKVEEMEAAASDHGGYKSAILRIEGENVWSQLGYESGTHQVKRVPATEAQGRVHTSTATVAVLSEPEEVELELNVADVKEMITTAQGPGGQNVNKVATAVHLIHEPSGIEVRMQDTKSQSQNREKAWALLRARLFERQQEAVRAERAELRASMIGSGSRAEKIRTYRYKDNMVVDHRISQSFNLSEVMAGNMVGLIARLREHDTAQRLAAL